MDQEGISGILDEFIGTLEHSAWAFLWTLTAVCLLALAFAAFERLLVSYRPGGNGSATMPQVGAGRTLGRWLMVLGVCGLILCLAAWTVLFGDTGRWFRLLFARFQDAANSRELTILVVSVLSMLIFDFGAFKFLSSERPVPKSGP